MQAVVLAGGKGTRLSGSNGAPPKALALLGGLPAIDHVFGWLAREGVTDVLLCLGHRAGEIRDTVGGGERFGLCVRAFAETTPLGTAGAVKRREAELEPRFFVIYADVVADLDLARMLQFHLAHGALATLAVHPNDHPHDSDRVVTDREGRIVRVVRKDDDAGAEAGALASAALYVMERSLLTNLPGGNAPSDFARDVFPALLVGKAPLFAYRTTEYIKDMGTPDRRDRVEKDILRGVPSQMRLSALRPAVLTDRDGVLITDAPRITTSAQIELLPGVTAALEKCNHANVLTVCCTNQPILAWGELSFDGLHELHTLLEGKLGAEGAWLDAIYFCPHHPERGFPGERPELKRECSCRKPMPGMLLAAATDLGIDRRVSVFVGDRTIDLRAARAAGVLGIGVLTGTALRDGKCPIAPETPIVATFADAVNLVLETVPSWEAHLETIRERRIVLLGGVSRAGKTVAASALGLALSAKGVPSLHVSLDRFIKPLASRRPGSSVGERTNFDAARLSIQRLARHEPTLLPSYDPRKREAAPGEVLTWSHGVLVVDGVLAGALDVPSAYRIGIVATPEDAQARRRAFYTWKGVGEREIAAVLREREEEEREIATLSSAPHVSLRLDERGRLGPPS